jgi:hypothetical protein
MRAFAGQNLPQVELARLEINLGDLREYGLSLRRRNTEFVATVLTMLWQHVVHVKQTVCR